MKNYNIIKQGSKYSIIDEKDAQILTKLEPGNYIIQKDKFNNIFLEPSDKFEHIEKYYQDIPATSERVLKTYLDRKGTTGILLTGEKGSGKTLLAKHICLSGYELGMPVIVINQSWHGNKEDETDDSMTDKFSKFIQSIEQDCIIFIDEFEKIYDGSKQKYLLSLLDGTHTSKKLFILTANSYRGIINQMINRPGRIYYHIHYESLEQEFIDDFCSENLKNKDYLDEILNYVKSFEKINFDMIKHIVEEINRYDSAPKELLKILNIKPIDSVDDKLYNCEVIIDDELVKLDDNSIWTDPLGFASRKFFIESYSTNIGDEKFTTFSSRHLIKLDYNPTIFTYKNEKGHILKLKTESANKRVNLFDVIDKNTKGC